MKQDTGYSVRQDDTLNEIQRVKIPNNNNRSEIVSKLYGIIIALIYIYLIRIVFLNGNQ